MMEATFKGPCGVALAQTLRDGPVAELRTVVAERAYEQVYAHVVEHWSGGHAHVLGLYSVTFAATLLPAEDLERAIERIASFQPFQLAEVDVPEQCRILTTAYARAFRIAGWDVVRRNEALKGLAIAFMQLANQLCISPTIHHVNLKPNFLKIGFPKLINRLVFGLKNNEPTKIAPDSASPMADKPPPQLTHIPDASADEVEVPISALIETWIADRNLSSTEPSRRRSSVRLFVIAADLTVDAAASMLAKLDPSVGSLFEQLSEAVGRKWGTAPASVATMRAREIISIATAEPVPAWAQHPLAPRGRKARVAHARNFLAFVRDHGIAVPEISWGNAAGGDEA